ncbi:MAG: gamma-glutamyl-gamma-aminobutyrate hydrolase family protein, partial [Hyphomonadaceae bacterium]
MDRPVIGLILDEMLDPPQDGSAFSRRPFYALRIDYFDAVAAAGGAPVAIPYRADALDEYLRLCDGWLIPGGDYRFQADWYETPPPAALVQPSLRRGIEIEAARRILAADAPVLGVCNGMQVLAGVTGGKIAWRGPGPRPGGTIAHGDPGGALMHHEVTLAPDGPLAGLFGAGRIRANSAHREDVVRLGPGARLAAQADDGVIEALSVPGRRFAIGVQWHPELEAGQPPPLVAALVAAARGR